MLRSILAVSAIIAAATPTAASTYSARPAVPVSQRFITRDIVWACGPAACQGSTETGRPVVLCQSLAKRAGHIDSFIVNGRELSAAELARCNASARNSPVSALAAQ